MRIEVYGSLLYSEQREKPPLRKGMIIELGKQPRIGWKLSFDKFSSTWGEAVLNFVWTGNKDGVYYTTVYEVDTVGYDAVMEREMGRETTNRWKRSNTVSFGSYRPFTLNQILEILWSLLFHVTNENSQKLIELINIMKP